MKSHIERLLYRLILLAGLLSIFIPCAGQRVVPIQTEQDSLFRHISREMSAEWSCRFIYAQGSGLFFSYINGNAAELEKLDAFIRQALSHPTLFISRIRLTGYASIEGGYARNEFLARQRVELFYRYLREYYPELYRYPHDMAWVAEDWGGLSAQLKSSPLHERREILEIIRKVPAYEQREAILRKLNGGYAWLFMERELFPELRRVELRIEYSAQDLYPTASSYNPVTSPQPSPREREFGHAESGYTVNLAPTTREYNPTPTGSSYNYSTPVASPQPTPAASPQPSPKEEEPDRTASDSLSFGAGRGKPIVRARTHFAIKTNLLLLAGVQSDFKYTTPVANIALEYYINEHWSVEAGAMYSYWHYNADREFQGISGYRLETRYRYAFPGDRLEAYLGLYGRSGDYDSRTIDKSVDSSQLTVDSDNGAQPTVNSGLSTVNFTGDYWDAGLSAGVSVRLVGNLGLEAGVRAGYARSNPYKYTQENNYNWFESRWRYKKVGIMDLNLSLLYRF